MIKKIIIPLSLLSLLVAALSVFWQQEVKYLLPTPVPADYQPVSLQEAIQLEGTGLQINDKPALLHFFNPNCPCSRFNIDHFVSLVKEYGHQVDFKVVIQYSTDTLAVRELLDSYDVQLPIIADSEEMLASRCGVYATPQAVILNTDGSLFYRGNYNRSRYCTDKKTSYARLALEAITSGIAAAPISPMATTAYGCSLTDKTDHFYIF